MGFVYRVLFSKQFKLNTTNNLTCNNIKMDFNVCEIVFIVFASFYTCFGCFYL